MIALVLVGLIAAQEPDVDALLKQLDNESIEVREKAAASLVALGEKAEERIRKEVAAAQGEVKGRLEGILKAIDLGRKLKSLMPPPRRVTISMKEVPLKDVIAEFKKQTGFPLVDNPVPDSVVSFTVRDLPAFEALDELCRLMEKGYAYDDGDGGHFTSEVVGGGGDDDPPIFKPYARDGRWRLRFGDSFLAVPRVSVRQYSVSITRLKLIKETDFGATRVQGHLDLRLEWPYDMRPQSIADLRIDRIVDDKDRVLFDAEKSIKIRRFWERRIQGFEHQESVGFKYPEADARTLKSVTGTASIRYSLEERTATFADAAGAVGKSETVDGREVTLKSFKEEGKALTVVVEIVGPRRTEEEGGDVQSDDVSLKLGDKPGPGWYESMASRHRDRLTLTLKTERSAPGAASLVIVVSRVFHNDTFEFEFKDIRLPR